MDSKKFAFVAMLVGLAVGLAGNLLFFRQALGLSFPLFALVVIGALIFTARFTQRPINRRNLWPLIPSVLFAGMVAVYADWNLMVLNMGVALGLGALTLAFLPMKEPLDEAPVHEMAVGSLAASVATGFGAVSEIGEAWKYVRENGLRDRGTLIAIMRGLLITAPIILVFAILLGSADAVFGSYLTQFEALLRLDGLTALIEQSFLVLLLAWLTLGGLAYGLTAKKPVQTPALQAESKTASVIKAKNTTTDTEAMQTKDDTAQSEDDELTEGEIDAALLMPKPAAVVALEKRKNTPIQLSIIEAGIVLAAIDALFTVFVAIQFRYFFGGTANVQVGAYTYSEYARKGFFELLAVSVMTLGLMLLLDWVTVRQEKREHTIFRVLSLGVVGLIGVMILSASQRMELYEQSYGFTHLRVYSHVFIWWIAVLFGAFILALFRVRKNVFSLGLLLVTMGYVGTLNLMNVDLYIATRNIERYQNGGELDICYLRSLSMDAAPAMHTLVEITPNELTSNVNKDDDFDIHLQALSWFADQKMRLERYYGNPTLFSLNLAREETRARLARLARQIPEYGGSRYLWCYDGFTRWMD